MRLPARWRRMAAAIGERTALRLQAKRTAPGRSAAPANGSALPMQRAEQREQAACGRKVDGDLALEPLHQELAAFVVNAAPPHVDRFDLRGRLRLDRLIISLADEEVVLHQPAEGRKRQHHVLDRRAIGIAHGEHEAIVSERETQCVRPAIIAFERKSIALEEIENRDLALVLDLGVVAADRGLIARDLDEARPLRPGWP